MRKRKKTNECVALDYLVDRLRASTRYYSIEKNVEYNSMRWNGELDVDARAHVNGKTYFHYYERKAIMSPSMEHKAVDQIHRWMEYMHHYKRVPYEQLKGVIYSSHYVKRVKPDYR